MCCKCKINNTIPTKTISFQYTLTIQRILLANRFINTSISQYHNYFSIEKNTPCHFKILFTIIILLHICKRKNINRARVN